MKICLISNLYPPLVLGGAERNVEKVAIELVKKGHEVVVITTTPGKKMCVKKANGVKIYLINPLNLYNIYEYQKQPTIIKTIWHGIDLWNPDSYFSVKKILDKEKPDVVHIHHFKGLSPSIFTAVKNLNLPLVFTAHDCSLICPKSDLLHANGDICTNQRSYCSVYTSFQKYLLKNKIDWFIAPSQFLIDKLKTYGFFKDSKTTKIPLGIEFNNKKEKTYDNIDILYAGNLSKNKGVQILIEAFKRIKYANISLHILGKGVDEAEFKKSARKDKRIIFHGFITGKNLVNFYQKSNICVIPSICYDNSPMTIYESFMSGTVVIGSKIGGIPELIKEDCNGFLFEPGNVNELRIILEKLISNPSKLKNLEQGAFKSAEKYSMKNHIMKLEKIYKSLNK